MPADALSNLLFIGLMVGAFWFLVIRPQSNRAKQQKAMLDALAVGDEVVTIGGIYGTVVALGERVRIRVADGSEFEIAVPAVASVVERSSEGDGSGPGMSDAEETSS